MSIKLTLITTLGVLLTLGAALMGQASAQDTRYVCTEFIGYSQTGQWVPYASQVMVAGGVDRVENRLHDGGAAIRWADPSYEGWSNPLNGPCATESTTPGRVIVDITHYDYLTAAHGAGDPVGYMEAIIRNLIVTVHAKRPAMVSLVLQPVMGGPNHGTCPTTGQPSGDPAVVRASYNHPYIDQAISRVVGGDVTRGYDNLARTCADYADWMGHLSSGAFSPIGTQVGTYYRDLNLNAPTPTRTPTVVPTATRTPTPTIAPPLATATAVLATATAVIEQATAIPATATAIIELATAIPATATALAATATAIAVAGTPTPVPCYDAIFVGDTAPDSVRGASTTCPP